MFTTLLKDLLEIEGIELWTTRDRRLQVPEYLLQFSNLNIKTVEEYHDLDAVLLKIINQCDAVWPIAPETGNLLESLCERVEGAGKHLLSSSSKAVKIAGNKLKTYHCLKKHSIPAVTTYDLSVAPDFGGGKWVLKPVDGVGCEGVRLIGNDEEFKQYAVSSAYIIQPYVEGNTISLSCLFKQNRAWLICRNGQKVEQTDGQFFLRECAVNIGHGRERYQALISQIAQAFPGLWGYVGIDMIETDHGDQVLEINPRLTTSYAGIHKATGVNIAKNVLELLQGIPELEFVSSDCVTIKLP